MSTLNKAAVPDGTATAAELAQNRQPGSPGGWGGQNPGRTTDAFMAALLGAILASILETGAFNMKQLDHRAGFAYLGVSNKELAIHASQLLGRPVGDYHLAKLIVLDTLIRQAGTEPGAALGADLLEQLNGGSSATAEQTEEHT